MIDGPGVMKRSRPEDKDTNDIAETPGEDLSFSASAYGTPTPLEPS
ncbi:uncharacterized protein METZ01_LOCUS354071, partial [marine metagenome]